MRLLARYQDGYAGYPRVAAYGAQPGNSDVRQLVDRANDEVKSAYRWAMLKRNVNPDLFLRITSAGKFVLWLTDAGVQDDIDGLFTTIGKAIAQWETLERQRAEKGDPNYGWDRWFDRGRGLLQDIAYAAQASWDNTLFMQLWQTGQQWQWPWKPGGILTPGEWPWWVWALIGIGGIGVIGYTIGQVRAVLPALPARASR